ncbi:MAG: Rpn family recombination-promoting nuclease/putative transposase [Planctomycetaceae bacterium]|jgi:predicted transposase/invertase (TIGR01784 family)|nr:Rpn family recombination-promoting nuclease/putative transposase [Planctomycetaceae bacterium]
MPARYINPYTDFGFKKLFGEEANKDLLIDFLNSVLPPKHQIQTLTFQNTENLPDSPVDRRAVFDIACESSTGEKFIVEMQKAKQHYFRDRALFYAAYPILRQAQKGDWNYQLKAVYFVGILDFEYDTSEERRKFLREVSLKDQDGDEFSDKLHIFFLQMPFFTKSESELTSRKDKWSYFLKHLEDFEQIPAILREPVFERAFATAEYVKLPLPEQEKYEQELKIYRDNYSVLDTAHMEGWLEGEAAGLEKGKIEGKIETARNLKRFGVDRETIAKATGLPVGEIDRLD